MSKHGTRAALLCLALALTAGCGDKESGDDTAAGGDSGADTDADTDVDTDVDTDPDTDPDTDADSGTADPSAGCLDTTCDFPAVLATVMEACEAAVTAAGGDPSAATGTYTEQRGPEAYPGIGMGCTTTALDDTTCPAFCEGLGSTNAFYNTASNECSCGIEVPSEATFSEELAAIVCDPATAQVALYGSAGATEYTSIQATCRSGATGTGACEDFVSAVNTGLDATFANSVDFGAGCGASGP